MIQNTSTEFYIYIGKTVVVGIKYEYGFPQLNRFFSQSEEECFDGPFHFIIVFKYCKRSKSCPNKTNGKDILCGQKIFWCRHYLKAYC